MNSSKVAYIRITFEDLKKILDLPKDFEVINVESGAFIHEHRAIHVILQNDKLAEIPDGVKVPAMTWKFVEQCKNSQENTSSTP